MAHIHQAIDFTVAAFIVYKRSVLLVDHIKLKRWLPVGGHIELTEDPIQALFREVEEETGIRKEDLEVEGNKPDINSDGTKFLIAPTYLDIHKISDTHQHIGLTYLIRSKTDQIKRAETEHNDLRWVDLTELASQRYNLSKAVKFYSEEAIKSLGWD
ncbi:NUDIX domain-containing protein [Candidatus Daviesbacteria bacterium]|nr:NUDIX domain-containing protein [Candidatus Daviesbacteria bacterium]